jgi:hypothetical protein
MLIKFSGDSCLPGGRQSAVAFAVILNVYLFGYWVIGIYLGFGIWLLEFSHIPR